MIYDLHCLSFFFFFFLDRNNELLFNINDLLIGLIWQALFVIYTDRDCMLRLLVTQSLYENDVYKGSVWFQ